MHFDDLVLFAETTTPLHFRQKQGTLFTLEDILDNRQVDAGVTRAQNYKVLRGLLTLDILTCRFPEAVFTGALNSKLTLRGI